MSKQELFILGITGLIWLATLLGQGFPALMYFYLFTGLQFSNIFSDFRWLRIPFVTAVLALFAVLVRPRGMMNKKRAFISSEGWLMIALFGVMCLSRVVNGLEVMGHPYMDAFFKIIFAYLLITNLVDTKEKLKWMIWLLVIVSGILAFDARYNDSPVPYPWESKNGFAVDLVSVIGFAALLFLWQQKRILKVEAAFYFVVLFMGIIGSNSRGNYVAVGVVFMLLLLKNFKIKYLLLLVVLISLVLVRVSDVHWERFSSITVDTDQGGTGGQRLALWSTGLRMIGANPLLGVGPGEFPLQFSRYANWQEQKRVGGSNLGSEKINVHNMYLQIGAENGLIGLALYLMIIAFSMRNILVAQRLCRGDPGLQDLMPFVVGLGLGFVGYLVAGIFGNYGYRLQFYTLVALATVTKFVVEEARVHKKQESTRQSDAGFILTRFQVPIRALAFILFSYMTLQL